MLGPCDHCAALVLHGWPPEQCCMAGLWSIQNLPLVVHVCKCRFKPNSSFPRNLHAFQPTTRQHAHGPVGPQPHLQDPPGETLDAVMAPLSALFAAGGGILCTGPSLPSQQWYVSTVGDADTIKPCPYTRSLDLRLSRTQL